MLVAAQLLGAFGERDHAPDGANALLRVAAEHLRHALGHPGEELRLRGRVPRQQRAQALGGTCHRPGVR